jgi:hypothetical protein
VDGKRVRGQGAHMGTWRHQAGAAGPAPNLSRSTLVIMELRYGMNTSLFFSASVLMTSSRK